MPKARAHFSASRRQQRQTEADPLRRRIQTVLAFTLEAVAVFALLQLISRPVWFIALFGFCFFAWGEIFALFPSITGDFFGKS
jgi:MFS transporter, OFA family, oxalate/formate antiporter